MKLCKENHGIQLSLYILKLSIFSCQPFCNSGIHFHYFTFCFKFYFPIAGIIVSRLYMLFLRSSKTNTKCYNKKRKKSVARNILALTEVTIFWMFFTNI